MKRLLLCLIAFAALLTLTIPVQGQPKPGTAFADLLRYIPDTPEVRDEGEIAFVDIKALLAAKGLTTDDVRVALASDPNSETAGRYWNGVGGTVSAGNFDLIQGFFELEKMRAATGIDPLAIERFVSYAAPPAGALVIQGIFDPQQVQTAFAKYKYEVVPQEVSDKGVLICPNGSCDIGAKVNAEMRNRDNPFGGALGRQPPLFVAPDLILYSIEESFLRGMLPIYAGKTPVVKTLADALEYRALTSALSQVGTLLQVRMSPVKYTEYYVAPPIRRNIPTMTPDPNFQPLPNYSAFAIVHSADKDAQAVTLAFVFANTQDAEIASTLMRERLNVYQSLVNRLAFTKLIADRGGILAEPIIIPGETATSPVTLLLRFDTPPENANEPKKVSAGGLLYRLFVDSFVQRDNLWYATGKP